MSVVDPMGADIVEMVGQDAYDEADALIEDLQRTVGELARRVGDSVYDPSTDCGEALTTLANLRRQLQMLDETWGQLAWRLAAQSAAGVTA